jgi:peptidoglycan/LPS O-acetylase OafA/YrhL
MSFNKDIITKAYSSIEKPKKIYFENLDALRFLCFLSVFFYHSFYTENIELKSSYAYHFLKKEIFGNGNIGVNLFFVLSGFLITYLLIKEKQLKSKINIPNFWIRRVLRIWPIYFLCVFIGFVLFPFLKEMTGQVSNETASPLYYMLFASNFDMINSGLPDASILGVLWSVSIEEQFYLIWPIIIYHTPIKKLWWIFSSIIVISISYQFTHNSYTIREIHTLSCMGDLAIGAFGSWLIIFYPKFKNIFVSLEKYKIWLLYLSFISIYFWIDNIIPEKTVLKPLQRTIIGVIGLSIILEQVYSNNSVFKLGRIKLFSSLGKISYGLYCLHFIGILISINFFKFLKISNDNFISLSIECLLSLLITIIISKISFKYFESPILKFKTKFAIFSKD